MQISEITKHGATTKRRQMANRAERSLPKRAKFKLKRLSQKHFGNTHTSTRRHDTTPIHTQNWPKTVRELPFIWLRSL